MSTPMPCHLSGGTSPCKDLTCGGSTAAQGGDSKDPDKARDSAEQSCGRGAKEQREGEGRSAAGKGCSTAHGRAAGAVVNTHHSHPKSGELVQPGMYLGCAAFQHAPMGLPLVCIPVRDVMGLRRQLGEGKYSKVLMRIWQRMSEGRRG